MTRSFMFLIIETKFNIVFAIFVASYFAKNLGYQYLKAIKIILQYLKGLNK